MDEQLALPGLTSTPADDSDQLTIFDALTPPHRRSNP